jgi:phosphotriesterase-related protein
VHDGAGFSDTTCQDSLTARGAWPDYDMIGMDFVCADQTAQSPCDEENAIAIVSLLRSGFGGRLLRLSDRGQGRD